MNKLEKRRQALLTYLESAINVEDWHGASDACNDLRELDVEIRLTKLIAEPFIDE